MTSSGGSAAGEFLAQCAGNGRAGAQPLAIIRQRRPLAETEANRFTPAECCHETGIRHAEFVHQRGAPGEMEPEMRDGLAMVATLDSLIARRLSQAVAAGELPTDLDVARAAMLLGGVLHSIAIRARAGTPCDALLRLADAGAATL